MAAPRSTTRSASQAYRRQALMWLVATLLLGVVTALVWMFSQTPAMGAKIENAPITAPQPLSAELEQPLTIESLHELDTDVQPLSFDATIRDLRSYPDEFKDKRYLLANKGKWTVQVMNVAENDVIVSYLESRDDRKKFAYFRYLDDENQVRYMLTYGLMSSPQEAVGASKLVDFKLPADVRVLPEEINRYISIIDNYERPDPIKDLSNRRVRAVDLRPTKREVPVRQPAETDNNDVDETRRAPSSSETSIRQSIDTSETLSVTEERIVGGEEQSPVTAGNEESSNKPADNQKPVAAGGGSSNKKPPVVPTPKPPSSSSGANAGANSAANSGVNNASNKNSNPNKNSNTGTDNKSTNQGVAKNNNAAKNDDSTKSDNATKNNGDSIKELIEEKSN
ncbi:hypothetical protein R0I52_03785 [Psychrobacter sp. CAM01]|uniref:hypothetical protein n=1 Tax=Psychrobacter sp. CAM01 TaxID=3080335 RepID=UPI002935FD6E|nr:hypothetical protein [Psychrobacter sp. CAM01]MDV2859827.1 hypothetical protein [Psychrobacter sp. CAM01]